MTKQVIDTQGTLTELFGALSEYPRQNIVQRLMQNLVSEIGRAQHLTDRIELGDNAVHDANGQRPVMDGQPSTLSENQLALVQRCADDESTLIDALLELKDFYLAQFAEQPQYGLKQDDLGKWHPITDFGEACAHEYRRAHQAWDRRNQQQGDADDQAAVRHLVADSRAKAASRAAAL